MASLVAALADRGQLEQGAVVVYEHASGSAGIDGAGLPLSKSKSQGATTVDLMIADPEGIRNR